jgi:small GTP-binding protein
MKNIRSDLKIIVVGNANTGKTSFVNKWTKNLFQDTYKATIVSEFGYKIFELNGKVYRIQVWDLAGQDKSATMTKVFCKDSHGVIILCDITDSNSLDATIKWKKSIDDSVAFFDGSPLPMMLVQNKIDLINSSNREQYNEELKDFAMKNGFMYSFQASVKEGINVTESMNDFLTSVIEKTEKMKIKTESFTNQEEKHSIIISPETRSSKKDGSSCCK